MRQRTKMYCVLCIASVSIGVMFAGIGYAVHAVSAVTQESAIPNPGHATGCGYRCTRDMRRCIRRKRLNDRARMQCLVETISAYRPLL